jgi:hypothetical protein
LIVAGLAIVLALALAGCGNGGNDTTTTIPSPGEETTTSTGVPLEETTTTGAIEESTTTTSPVEETTTTSAVEDTTTTTEKLSTAETRLPNGRIKAMGFVDKVWEEGGKRYISIDYAEMLTGQAAIDAAAAAGDLAPGEDLPNDYYIRNTNPEKRQFEVAGNAALTTSTWQDGMDNPITWAQFTSFWSATPPDDALHMPDVPWWIERDGTTVVRIDEQYLP